MVTSTWNSEPTEEEQEKVVADDELLLEFSKFTVEVLNGPYWPTRISR
jgi:hypothetical protein